jgi:hypothetical protein
MSRAKGIGARHPQSETSVYKHGHPRPKLENVAFEPEDGDIFDEWMNGGDDGRQQAAWEEATAIWDREAAIGKARQMDRMFCVTESALRMLHGCTYSTDAAWLGILADVGFRGVREAGWLRRIITHRISEASQRQRKRPSSSVPAETAKRQRRAEDHDLNPRTGGSGTAEASAPTDGGVESCAYRRDVCRYDPPRCRATWCPLPDCGAHVGCSCPKDAAKLREQETFLVNIKLATDEMMRRGAQRP